MATDKKARLLKATEKSRSRALRRIRKNRTPKHPLRHKTQNKQHSPLPKPRLPRTRRRNPLRLLRSLAIRATTAQRAARKKHRKPRTLVHRNQRGLRRTTSKIHHRTRTQSHKRANAPQILRWTQRTNSKLLHPQAQRWTRTRLAQQRRRQAPRANKPQAGMVETQARNPRSKRTSSRRNNHRNRTSHRRTRNKTQPRRRMTTQKRSPSLAACVRTADLLRRVLVQLPLRKRGLVGRRTPLALKRLGRHQRTRHQNNRTRRSRIQRTRLKYRTIRTQTRHIHRHQL